MLMINALQLGVGTNFVPFQLFRVIAILSFPF
jgi:hypothetical protein